MDGTSPVPSPRKINNDSEDQPRLVKFLCSFGGSVLPRPLDGRLRYVGGETRIITVPHDISFCNLLQRMSEIFEGADLIKYQQPDEDLDALVSVVNDDDVINMMEEYDKLISSGEAFTRLRIFLFSQNALEGDALNSPSTTVFDAVSERESERRYVDALNCLADPKSGLISPDGDGSIHGNISLRHLNVPRPSAYGPKFADVDSPYNGVGHFSPRFQNPQTHDLLRDQPPFGAEDFNEKSGYPGHFLRGDHVVDANCIYCEHCIPTPYHQRSGSVTPDARYLDPPYRYYAGHNHNGLSNPYGDCYRNTREGYVESNDHYNYYQSEPHGHDRMWAPQNQVNYRCEDSRAHRVPDLFAPDGNRVNYLYPQGNIHGPHDNARIYNPQVATEVGTNEMFCNAAQLGENPPQQYNQAMYNLESLYQVPQNLPPIPSLRPKKQVHMVASASPTQYESPNALGVNPTFVRVNQEGTPNGGINPVFVRIAQEGTPNGGLNPVFVRAIPEGNPNGGCINPILFKATPDGTPNGGINPAFVRATPDATPSGGGIKPSFMIGTPEDSPRLSGVGPFDRIPNNWVAYTENCSQKVPGLDLCAGMPEYGQQPGSRFNPNFPIQENGLQCQTVSPVMGSPITGNLVSETAVNETPATESSVQGTPLSEIPVEKNPITIAPFIDEPSMRSCAPSSGIPPGKVVGEPRVLLDLHKATVCMGEKPAEEGALATNRLGQNGDLLKEEGSPVKQLGESIKAVTLQAAEAVAPEDKANNEESDLHEVAPEKGNMDFEVGIESSESEGVSKIESTTAELEALDKGLQTIKNEDLEEIRELGHGTYGSVYHGKWRGSDVAIKRIKASCFNGSPSERNRLIADFWKEAQILSSLHHPNVVSFYGVVRDGPDGGLATVTEFMVNGSLKQFLNKKDRTIDRRKRIILAMDAAFGMEYLHSKNIVHFDLKCENLLVNMKDAQRPICKIGDLGLSKVKQHTMVSGGVRGTLPWMAPELLNGKSNMVSEKVDVYSFGICLWELLTGEEPYAEMKAHSIIGGILNDSLRPQIPSWCDPEWKALMQSCWSTDPNERPSFSEISQKLRKMAPK